ncbi:MAG: outer membrane beta-barrel protein [Spirochaetota bacterium]
MFKKLALCILMAAVACMTTGLQAQEMTDDVAFLRVGYQWNTIKYDDPNADDSKLNGMAVEGEYNLNLGGMLLGFALEYAYLSDKDNKAYDFGFLTPMVTVKFLAPGGFYIGPGVSLRYLMSSYLPKSETEPDSEVDLWVNGVAGFMTPIAEGIYFDVEARFGWNLTKNQFAETGYEIDKNYNMALYIGVGTRTRATGI